MGKFLIVTGKLAERALRATLTGLDGVQDWEVAVMPITVASLMTADWLARHLTPPPDTELILVPGLCRGDLAELERRLGIPVKRGPEDVRDLPEFFGRSAQREGYGACDSLIFAEIHHVTDLDAAEILRQAEAYRAGGADVIDLGCKLNRRWTAGPEIIADLKAKGFRLSIDTFDPWEIQMAIATGVDFVLSVHGANAEAVRGCPCPVVVVPDPERGDLDSLAETAARLNSWGVPYILDPVLSPIHFGFADSLHRFVECRRRFPTAEMMLGAHHLTELLDADTTGVNAVVAGFARELGIRNLLTTEVAPWTRGSVRELDIARRLMYYSGQQGVLPRRLEDRLLTIKDRQARDFTESELRELQGQIRDHNFRIYTDRTWIYVFNAHIFVRGQDPREIFAQLGVSDPGHAFYLGRELMQASLAVQLGKVYRQGQGLNWGYLTPTPGSVDAGKVSDHRP